MDEVGLTAKEIIISCPDEMPPKIPPALFDLKFIFFPFFKISSEFSSPVNCAEFIPDPIFIPFTALILIIAEARSISNFEYIGAPNPIGTPLALTSIIAPHEDPAFLTLKRYFSQSFIIDLSGQKNGFLEINLSFHFLRSQPSIPSCVTAPITLYFLPILFSNTFFAIAPAATLAAVSLADCLPPPL